MTMFSEGAEQALVAKLLLDPRKIALVSGLVKPEDFGISDYRKAYEVMLKLAEERKPFDIIALQSAGVDVDVLDMTILHHAPLEEYAATIREKAFTRRVAAGADRVGRAAQAGDKNLMRILNDTFTDLVRGSDQGEMTSPSDAVEDYLGTLAGRIAGDVKPLTYGVPGMDNILLPAGPGEMIVMAARPGVGKSAMAENVADHWSRLGRGPVLFVSVEMRKDQIMDRTLSRYSGISAKKIILGDLTDEEMALVRAKAEELRERPVIFLANGFTTSLDVRSAAAKAKMLYGELSGIVVDYMQKLMDDGDQEVQRVTRISRNLKAIAVENNCPLIALSQLSRRIEMDGDREPELSDLRESGAIEQDADAVVFMLRKNDSPSMRVFVKKQRQGALGKFRVQFDGDHSQFSEAPAFFSEIAGATTPQPDPEAVLGW